MSGEWEGGKGSRPRKYSVSKYQDNYERIFGSVSNQKQKEQTGQMGAIEADSRNHKKADEQRDEP